MKYQRIVDLREDAEEKQGTIAKLLGTSQTQYSRWERGEREIPFRHIITLAIYYKVSVDYIAGLTNDKNGGVQLWLKATKKKRKKPLTAEELLKDQNMEEQYD